MIAVTVDGEAVVVGGHHLTTTEAEALAVAIRRAAGVAREARVDRETRDRTAAEVAQAREQHPDGWAVGNGWAWWSRHGVTAIGAARAEALQSPDGPEWVRVHGGRVLHRVDRAAVASAVCGANLRDAQPASDLRRCPWCEPPVPEPGPLFEGAS